MHLLQRGTFHSIKLLGITNRRLPLAMSWPSCGGICGATSFSLHLLGTPMSSYCLARHLPSLLMRHVTEQESTKSSPERPGNLVIKGGSGHPATGGSAQGEF